MIATGNLIEQAEWERDAFVERVLKSTAGTFDIFSIYLGDRLGLYRALARAGAMTSGELAARTGTAERYVREWLEQQAVTGVLHAENPTAGPADRRFRLPAGHAEVLADRDSLSYLAGFARLLVGAVRPVDAVVEAFRTGGGVPFSAYGADLREGQADTNRPAFLRQLGAEWLPSIPDVHARLLTPDPPARVADIGCGLGWSCIGIARSYRHVRVDGFDLDEASAERARANVRDEGLADRVGIHCRDAGDASVEGEYDLVTAFECVHDLSDPVGVLQTMRRLAGERGSVLVMDERVCEHFTPNAGEVEAIMYGWSVFHCLPSGMADKPSAATGTVMRPDTLRGYAEAAGFRHTEILPIDNTFFRFYRLHI
uniref:Bll2645 protein n=1 Tax=uncultured Armatimonadetes bacterium TaxID=157466 RepID=A0A6J4H1X5_9BACT|nr:Bll2645 protein [uncultured Armatimonadetes bacterium]